jgi:2-methylisocitrate lyase-like PEP mutase family enzyme
MAPRRQAEKAEHFRELHHARRVLILPNAWDVPSARVFEDEGFPAVATSSAAVMVSLGYPDGETIRRDDYLGAVRRISQVLSVPLSVDMVSGFGRTPVEVAASTRKLISTGAVGLNIEDFEHETKMLFPLSHQIDKLKAVRRTADSLGIPIVINARTDALRYGSGDEDERFKEAIARGIAFRDAGADCVYPMGLFDRDSISAYVKKLNSPVNVMVRKGLPPVGDLQRIGVSRVSFGPSASYAAMGLLKRISNEVMNTGTYSNLTDGAITFDELNNLARPKVKSEIVKKHS